jgi:phage protein D
MPSGSSRQPRAYLKIDGVDCIPIEVNVSMTAERNADNFGATLPLVAPFDEQYFSDTSPIPIEVIMTNDQTVGEWVQMFTGFCDVPRINFSTRRVILTGRDKTSLLIETKTSEKWLNKTTTDIVNEIASRVGLTADISLTSPDKVGLTYKDDYNRISNQDVLFNVLTVLAEREGCAVFVRGDRLIFKPADQMNGGVITVAYQAPTKASYANGTFMNLEVSRNLSVAKNVGVSVKTWSQKQKKSLSTSWRSQGASSTKLDYTYSVPNNTKEQIDKIAKNKLAEITGQERLIDLEMPGDVNITPENRLNLTGTNTAYDQSYTISRANHHMSQSGYRLTIAGRGPDKKNTIAQDS